MQRLEHLVEWLKRVGEGESVPKKMKSKSGNTSSVFVQSVYTVLLTTLRYQIKSQSLKLTSPSSASGLSGGFVEFVSVASGICVCREIVSYIVNKVTVMT